MAFFVYLVKNMFFAPSIKIKKNNIEYIFLFLFIYIKFQIRVFFIFSFCCIIHRFRGNLVIM